MTDREIISVFKTDRIPWIERGECSNCGKDNGGFVIYWIADCGGDSFGICLECIGKLTDALRKLSGRKE